MLGSLGSRELRERITRELSVLDGTKPGQPPVPLPSAFEVPYSVGISLRRVETLRHEAEKALAQASDAKIISAEGGRLVGALYSLGETQQAVELADRCIEAAELAGEWEPAGYLYCAKGAIRCYLGQYELGKRAFDAAEELFLRNGDGAGVAWKQHLYAREYACDHREYTKALESLNYSFQVLRQRTTPGFMVENLLSQVNCALHIGEMRRARELLHQAEIIMGEQKVAWYRAELFYHRAHLALIEGNDKVALSNCYSALGSVGDVSDLRMLTPLYLALGTVLSRQRGREDDTYDALDRAISTARNRGRRLHLAVALRHMGYHLRRTLNRSLSVGRARGSGLLFEADQMFQTLGLATAYGAKQNMTGLPQLP